MTSTYSDITKIAAFEEIKAAALEAVKLHLAYHKFHSAHSEAEGKALGFQQREVATAEEYLETESGIREQQELAREAQSQFTQTQYKLSKLMERIGKMEWREGLVIRCECPSDGQASDIYYVSHSLNSFSPISDSGDLCVEAFSYRTWWFYMYTDKPVEGSVHVTCSTVTSHRQATTEMLDE